MADTEVQSKRTYGGAAPENLASAKRALGRLLLVSAACLASNCAVGETSEESVAPAGEVISADGILVCPREGVSPDPWYSVTAMNNKLRNYPEFARVSGMGEVKTCADGRAFFKKYREYQQLVPNFDWNEPYIDPNFPETDPPPLTEEDVRAAEGIGPKIKNGTGDRLSPVVRLYRNETLTSYCTGTFIARNWIITAAHCLLVKPGFKRGVDQSAGAQLNGWYPYNIEFFGAQGKRERLVRYTNVRQYMDPQYTGFEPEHPYHAHDFALLYVHHDHDGALPNVDPSASASGFPFMRVSMAERIVDVSSATFWGAGLINNDIVTTPQGGGDPVRTPQEAGVTDSRLRRGSLAPYQVSFGLKPEPEKQLRVWRPDGMWGNAPAPRSVNAKLFYTDTPSSNVAVTCHGDSGGPLVEPWIVKDPNGNQVTAYVTAGVLSEHVFPSQRPCSKDSDCVGISAVAACDVALHECYDPAKQCQDVAGEGQGWVANAFERPFIEGTIRKWYQFGFQCTSGRRVDAGSGSLTSDQFLQCWGKPCLRTVCQNASDPACCGANEYCSRPGSELKSCIECPGGGCGCIYGQCLPNAPLEDL